MENLARKIFNRAFINRGLLDWRFFAKFKTAFYECSYMVRTNSRSMLKVPVVALEFHTKATEIFSVSPKFPVLSLFGICELLCSFVLIKRLSGQSATVTDNVCVHTVTLIRLNA